MSSGHFNENGYIYFRVEQFADELESASDLLVLVLDHAELTLESSLRSRKQTAFQPFPLMTNENSSERDSSLLHATSSIAVGFLEERAMLGKMIDIPSIGISFNRNDLSERSALSEKTD